MPPIGIGGKPLTAYGHILLDDRAYALVRGAIGNLTRG